MSKVSVLVGADIVVSKENEELFSEAVPEKIIGSKLWKIFNDCDFRIFNLETVVCDYDSVKPIKKAGPNIRASLKAFRGIACLNPTVLSIANNHVMDYGEEGLWQTIREIEDSGIKYLGAGSNVKEASKPIILEQEDIKIGIYSCAEHEFSIATDEKPGCSPYDPLESFDLVAELKDKCDFVIVLYHGGKEYYRYPSPQVQRICRKFADKGADVVLCQHTHCIGSIESYNDSTLVYGQGNFIFYSLKNECYKTGMLLKICIDKNSGKLDCFFEYIPTNIDGVTTVAAEGKEREKILREMNDRSEAIKQKGFIEQKYREFAKDMKDVYCKAAIGKVRNNLVFKVFNKLSGSKLIKKYYSSDLMLLNVIECEAHRELFIQGLKE